MASARSAASDAAHRAGKGSLETGQTPADPARHLLLGRGGEVAAPVEQQADPGGTSSWATRVSMRPTASTGPRFKAEIAVISISAKVVTPIAGTK